jgi:hypothetical protein
MRLRRASVAILIGSSVAFLASLCWSLTRQARSQAPVLKIDFRGSFIAEFVTFDKSPTTGQLRHGRIVVARNHDGSFFSEDVGDAANPTVVSTLGDVAGWTITKQYESGSESFRKVDYKDPRSFADFADRLVAVPSLDPSQYCLKTTTKGAPAPGIPVGMRIIDGIAAYGIEDHQHDSVNPETSGPACFRSLGELRIRKWYAPAYGCAVVLDEAHLARTDMDRPELVRSVGLKSITQQDPPAKYFKPLTKGPIREPKDYLRDIWKLDLAPKDKRPQIERRIALMQRRYEEAKRNNADHSKRFSVLGMTFSR